MQFDLMTVLGIGALAGMAIFLIRHTRGGTGEQNDRASDQRRDVVRALKSMRKD